MLKITVKVAALLCLGVGSAKAMVIIGGSTGNGNFNAGGGGTAGPAQTYDQTVNWFNGGGAESINFTQSSQMGGSTDPDNGTTTRGGMPFQNRLQVNDTPYTITAAGEVFSLSYDFGAGGGEAGWTNTADQVMNTFLFISTTPVDGALVPGDISQLGGDGYPIDRAGDGQWTTRTVANFYTTTPADIGKTVYFGMEFNRGATAVDLFPRIDVVQLEVTAGATNPPPTGTNITILGGVIGNADFEASEPTTTNPIDFANTAHWHNASGAETDPMTRDDQTGASSQPNSRAGLPFHNRTEVNDTGHTITTTGEVFSLSYDFGAGGAAANWTNTADQVMNTFLFTAAVAVDGNLTTGDMTQVGAGDAYAIDLAADGQWTTRTVPNFYTSTPADIGKTVYFGMVFDQGTSPTLFPRIDVVQLTVAIGGGDGGTTNPPAIPTGWQQFVLDYGLSGDQQADADDDGQRDVFEFLHGGNPTNAASLATAPSVSYATGGNVSLLSVETAHTNPGIAWAAQWTDNLATSAWHQVWDTETNVAAALPGYNDVQRQRLAATNKSLFCRVNLRPRPNILFILADDLGYADVSFNTTAGVAPEIMTPQMDSLATNGTIFTSAYVVHPFCGPSRMGLMAGRYPHQFGGPFNLPDFNSGDYTNQGISTNETLISTVLQNAGYHTGIMGKWHMGQQPEFHPNARGFDDFYGFLGGGQVYFGPYQAGGWDYIRYPQHNGVSDTSLTANDHITDVLTAKGTNFIYQAAADEDPFFLFMSYNAPHTVLTYNGKDQAKASDMAMFPALSGNRKIYAGLVYGMDRCVGELVQALKDTGQYDNTLIIFLSDNGGRPEDSAGPADNGVLRGFKGDVTEGGFRVPMFMHWPGVIPAGATYDHPVTALDFYPTFANLAQATVPVTQDIDGKDIWDAVLSGVDARPGEPIYTVTYSTSAASVGIRQDQWKALKLGTSTWKLYDIDNEIIEQTDVAGANPLVLSNLVSQGDAWRSDHVQPLWWNTTAAEATWNANNMPHYQTVFVLP